jgi:hypothetical protein
MKKVIFKYKMSQGWSEKYVLFEWSLSRKQHKIFFLERAVLLLRISILTKLQIRRIRKAEWSTLNIREGKTGILGILLSVFSH